MSRVSGVAWFGALCCAAVVAFGSGRSEATAARPGSPVLAFVVRPGRVPAGEQQSMLLARVDPLTLRVLAGKRLDVGSGGCVSRYGGEECWGLPAWAYSPGHGLLAVARNDALGARSLRLIDLARMRVSTDIPITGGPVGALAWLTGERLLALQEVCCTGAQRLVVVDLARRRVQARHGLGGSVLRVAQTGRDLVLLLAPAQAIGPARLAVIDGLGRVRFVSLQGMLAGVKWFNSDSHRDIELPGLALDPSAQVAFVVNPTRAAEIRLGSLAVTYRALRSKAATAKGANGDVRTAVWLGRGQLAVTGEHDTFNAGGTQATAAAGLLLLDTATWSVRALDAGATGVVAWRDLLLATGASAMGVGSDTGLAVYASDGSLRFHLFAGKQVWLGSVYRGLVDVSVAPAGGQPQEYIVDLISGHVLGTRPRWPPDLLLGNAAGWWDTTYGF
jgi:hypothetical protein